MYKIIFRSIFYHWLILLIGISIGFITNAEWLGYKSVIIEKSISNIFFPIEFTQEIENRIKDIGASKIFTELGHPNDFEILGGVVYYNDEFYWCKYKFRDQNNELKFGEATTRVRWKTWEYNYGSDSEVIDTEEKVQEAMRKLNNWHSKIREAIKQADEKEKELLRQEALPNTQHST
jgi:hypothetical protein